MEFLDKPLNPEEEREPGPHDEPGGAGATLFLRLWAHGGSENKLTGLVLEQNPEAAALITGVITEGHGQIIKMYPEAISAHFARPLQALVTAKTLQQRLLMLQGHAPQQQVVAAILISTQRNAADQQAASGGDDLESHPILLEEANAAQILVSEGISELLHEEPGFQFSPKPVREAVEGASEAIYELLWTDESTYGHLRDTGGSTGIHTAGRYEVQEELGRGAMGVVYKAFDRLIGRTVALKTISVSQSAPHRRELIERLKREAKAAGGLDHPNIITIFDVGQEDDRVYLSMQFLEGKTLAALLEEGVQPSLAELISYAEQVCSAVDYAHGRGVIHRDLKPANLMLTSQGIIKVLDFGIAKIEDATLTQTGMVVGTPSHMAPEQVADKKLDQRTDIFALGSVFYELFTREKPFRGDITSVLYKIMHEDPLPPSIINPALPGGIDAIIRKALAKDPKDRYQRCAEMGQAFHEQAAMLKTPAIRAAANPAPVPAPAVAPATSSTSYLLETRTLSAQKQRRVWPWVSAALLLAIGGVAGWAFYVKHHTGAFPPLVQRAAIALHVVHKPPEHIPDTTGAEAQEKAASHTNAPNNGTADAPAGRAADSAATGSAPPAIGDTGATPATQTNSSPATSAQNPATPTSSPSSPNAGVPADNVQASADAARTSSTAAPGTDAGTKLGSRQGDANAATQPLPANQQQSGGLQGKAATQNAAAAATMPPQDAVKVPAATDDPQTTATAQPESKKFVKKRAATEAAVKVDGFGRADVPELLRQADAAAQRGDYHQARYVYTVILKLDRNNPAARAGLQRANAAESDRAH
ncbi:MAG TPA: protein kinase [Candidatus Angelobacter sp.]|nr:protein kinase [Candidatus Angelobacter sp.]